MATATSNPISNTPIPLRKKVGYTVAAAAALIALWVILNFSDIKAQAQLGASYGAHIVCSCRYIEGRSLGSCEKDFEPGMELVALKDDPQNKRVAASVPLMAEAVAERRGDFGCIQLSTREMAAID
jgi:hypothetical protein